MNKVLWVVTAASLGVVAYVLLNQSPTTPAADVEDQSGAVGRWATKKRVSGTGNQVAGKLKQGVGQAFGDDKLQDSGVVDQVKGAAQDLAGKAAQRRKTFQPYARSSAWKISSTTLLPARTQRPPNLKPISLPQP